MPQIKHALIRYRIIDRLIRNKYKPYPSKQQLREACEEALYGTVDGANICDSTIEKDIFSLRMEFDAPIKYSKKFDGYYYLDPDFTINDIPLTEDELSSISFAVETLMQFKENSLFKQFDSAINKIFDRVSVASQNHGDDISTLIQFETAVSTGGNEHLPAFIEAIKNAQIIEFLYSNFISGTFKKRRVLPLMLKEYRNRWYVISFDYEKNDVVTYGLDRVSKVKITEEIGLKPKNFDPVSFFKYSTGISTGKGKPVHVIFKAEKIASKYIISQPFHETQKKMKEENNQVTFKMKVLISEELIRNIFSYGNEIEVLEPEDLRQIISERVKKMNNTYNKK